MTDIHFLTEDPTLTRYDELSRIEDAARIASADLYE